MALADLDVLLPANFVSGSCKPGTAWGDSSVTSTLRIPAIAAFHLQLWSSGSQVGKANQLCLVGGTVTDVAADSIDLQSLTNMAGETVSLAELNLLVVLNDDTTDANQLVLYPHATNGWAAPFSGMGTPADGKLTVLAGYTHPTDSSARPGIAILGGANTSGYAVDATHKVLVVSTAKTTAHTYRLIIAGRTAAS